MIGEILEKKAEGSTVLTGLRVAVSERPLTRLQALLDKGADINSMDVGGYTALTLAAYYGYGDAVVLLLRNGADVNMCGSREWPPLHWACEQKETAVVQLLIENGADVNANKNGWTAMLLAAKKECLPIVQSLLENGANINAQDYHGRRALHWAAGAGHRNMVWLLAEKKADLNAVDRWGRTALLWAIGNMQAEAFLLLDIGADAEARARDGSTALHLAAFKGEAAIAQQLLKRGASIEAKTRDNFTPLHIAAFMGCEEVAQVLLRSGANVEAEAQWPGADNRDEKEDDLAETNGTESFSERLYQLLLEQSVVTHLELEVQRALTVRQLAESGGHVAVQRHLGLG